MVAASTTRAARLPLARGRWLEFDWILLLSSLLLIAFGVAVIGSVGGQSTTWANSYALRQVVFATGGLVGMLLLTLINYRLLTSLAVPIYALNLVLLVTVDLYGYSAGGSTRWFDLKLFLLQPSLFGQLFLVLSLAALLNRWGDYLKSPVALVATVLLVAVPAYLVYKQPDLGSSMVYGFLWLAMVAAAPVRRLHLALLGVLSVPAAWFFWQFVAHDYQRDRVTIFLHPESDPFGQGFNILQARIAIGHGGLFGQGLTGGSQGQLEFLRVQTIDFVFAAASEQFGFAGCVALFVLYVALLWRCLVVAGQATEPFGQYLCVGVAAVYFFQAAVNIGMNVGLVPVTGIPLPLVSYGGSSLVALLMLQGLVQSVAIRRRKLSF